jgi:hypothetical protein
VIYPHKRAKYQFQIPCIFGYTKNDKCVDLSMYIFKSPNLIEFFHFCASPQYKESHIKNLHACRLHYWLCLDVWIIFFILFWNSKIWLFKKNRITGVQEPKALSIHDMVNPIKLCEKWDPPTPLWSEAKLGFLGISLTTPLGFYENS